jgi:hypothetical protein
MKSASYGKLQIAARKANSSAKFRGWRHKLLSKWLILVGFCSALWKNLANSHSIHNSAAFVNRPDRRPAGSITSGSGE